MIRSHGSLVRDTVDPLTQCNILISTMVSPRTFLSCVTVNGGREGSFQRQGDRDQVAESEGDHHDESTHERDTGEARDTNQYVYPSLVIHLCYTFIFSPRIVFLLVSWFCLFYYPVELSAGFIVTGKVLAELTNPGSTTGDIVRSPEHGNVIFGITYCRNGLKHQ